MRNISWNNSQINCLIGAIMRIATAGQGATLNEDSTKRINLVSYFFFSITFDAEKSNYSSSPVELASLINDNEQKKRTLEFLIIANFFTADHLQEKNNITEEYAKALKLSDLLVKQLYQVYTKYIRLLYANKLRNNLITTDEFPSDNLVLQEIQQAYETRQESIQLIEKYHKLTKLAKNSLGYNLYKFYRKNKFALPGEAGSLTDKTFLIYDLTHLLTNYKFDARGEMYNMAFLAGNTNNGSIIIAVLGLINYYLDDNLTPQPRLNKLEQNRFWKAMQSGMNCKLDLTSNWDYESWFHQSISTCRNEFNVNILK